MDGDRKYKQNGYQQSDRGRSDGQRSDGLRNDGLRNDSQRPQGPKPHIDVTGPRLPRLVQATAASRCNSCATTLPLDVDFKGQCPKCKADLHSCRQCAHFEPSTRFQCLKPIPERIPVKDKANECAMFGPRVTVARDSAPAASGPSQQQSNSNGSNGNTGPRNISDARTMFDNLFKK